MCFFSDEKAYFDAKMLPLRKQGELLVVVILFFRFMLCYLVRFCFADTD